MNWKTTLALAAIALAIFAYFRFFELKQPSTEEATRQAQNVVNFDRDKIDQIVIQNGDDKIEMRRHDSKWRLETPIKDQADNSLIEKLLMDLESWQKDATISAKEIEADKSKLNEYGLNKPKLKLKLIGQDRPAEILFGKDAALEGKMYVRFENSKETFLAAQTIKKDIEKKPEEFRQEIDRPGHRASLARRVKDACWRNGAAEKGRSLGNSKTAPRAWRRSKNRGFDRAGYHRAYSTICDRRPRRSASLGLGRAAWIDYVIRTRRQTRADAADR
jgi:hypothetical protein